MNQEFKVAKGTLRQRQKEETEQLILKTARHLFGKSGYHKTTIRKVAEKAGLGLGTIFNYFPDKISLLIATFLDDLARVQAEALDTLPTKAPISEQFLHISRSFYLYYAQHPSLSRTLLKEIWFAKGVWGEELVAEASAFMALVTKLLSDAKTRGEIRADADCHLIAMTFFSHYLNNLYMGLSQPVFAPDEQIELLGRMIDQLMIGIGTGAQT